MSNQENERKTEALGSDVERQVRPLPCPFCGEEPRLTSRMDEDLWTHNIVEWKGVRCTSCDFGFDWPPDSERSALERWNTRAV